MTTLTTARLVIRRARPDDLEALHAVLSDPRATTWWSTPPHGDRDQTRAWMADMLRPGPDREDFVVEHEGRVIGKAGFWRLPEIGYILHPDAWGQGLAGEALTAIIDHVFAEHPEHDRLTADVDPRNAASIRLLRRLGFVQRGEARNSMQVGGEWVDSLYFSLDRSAWSERLMIRRASRDDAPALHALIERAYRGEASRAGWTTEADLLDGQRTDREEIAEILADPMRRLLTAWRGGVLIGCVLIADRSGGVGYLGMLSVDPGLQGAGVGGRLVEAAEAALARDFGARRVRMQVIRQREALIAWYIRRGYRPTGETAPFPYGNARFGRPLRDDLAFVVLEKTLA
ncbi:GNAT family N-acetyltransferase [Brevundimonas lutea]|uniref:GNAT family N-acetyltransferase n=1 Tax=Brevundimonas lutea TaxID=2293980 RepID=UPI000F01DD2B